MGKNINPCQLAILKYVFRGEEFKKKLLEVLRLVNSEDKQPIRIFLHLKKIAKKGGIRFDEIFEKLTLSSLSFY